MFPAESNTIPANGVAAGGMPSSISILEKAHQIAVISDTNARSQHHELVLDFWAWFVQENAHREVSADRLRLIALGHRPLAQLQCGVVVGIDPQRCREFRLCSLVITEIQQYFARSDQAPERHILSVGKTPRELVLF